MKFLISQLSYFWQDRHSRANVYALLRYLVLLAAMITLYSILFHFIMAYEGREESWVTGFYWTLTVMSTLGFGDITFESDLGRIFSSIVLLSGIIFMLVILPFTFINLFYAPWLRAQEAARAPRSLPDTVKGHVVLTQYDAVTMALIERLKQFHHRYVVLTPELEDALRLHDLGVRVVRGDLDNPETYRRVHVEQAALVVTTANDRLNTNVAFTVREVSESVPIIATANAAASVDILELAGCNHVLQLGEMMGQALVRRVTGGDARAHVIGRLNGLVIAEATARNSPLVGQTLAESRLRDRVGVTVLGVWERGQFQLARPTTRIEPGTVLVLAGSEQQIEQYNTLLCTEPPSGEPVVIIGGGRVGRAAGRALAERGMDYRIVELLPERVRDPTKYVLGDAADLEVLVAAGIRKTPAVLVTTHDDDTNIYLTIYCRRLRPDVQIISRARLERNVATLHRAGADFVLSYASMGASTIMNLLNRDSILMVTEGLDVFEVETPESLVGKTIAEANIRQLTDCTVVALEQAGVMTVNPDPHTPLPAHAKMVLIGTVASENCFLKRFTRPHE